MERELSFVTVFVVFFFSSFLKILRIVVWKSDVANGEELLLALSKGFNAGSKNDVRIQ